MKPFTHNTSPTDAGSIIDSLAPEGYRAFDEVEVGGIAIPHVVVGPTGVFAVDVRPWTGKIHPKRGMLMAGRTIRDDALLAVMGAATGVRDHLWRCGIGLWARPILVCPSGRLREPFRIGPVTVTDADDLREVLTAGMAALRPADVDACVRAFSDGIFFAEPNARVARVV